MGDGLFELQGGANRSHNVHIFEKDNPEIERHLKFRDWMRMHVNDGNAYGNLKGDLPFCKSRL